MVIAIVIALPVPADCVIASVKEQVRNSRWLGMKNVTLRNSLDCAVIVTNPTAVTNMENICDIMAFAGFFTIVIDDCKKLILLLLLLVLILWRHDFYKISSEVKDNWYKSNPSKNSLWSIFSSTGNSTVLRILVQLSFLKSKHFKWRIKTTGSSSKVTCCHAATSWFVRLHVTPSNWSRPTRISKASRTEDAFCDQKNNDQGHETNLVEWTYLNDELQSKKRLNIVGRMVAFTMHTQTKLSSKDITYRWTTKISCTSDSTFVASSAYNLKLSGKEIVFIVIIMKELVKLSNLPFFFIITGQINVTVHVITVFFFFFGNDFWLLNQFF